MERVACSGGALGRARLSGKALAVGVGGQPTANSVKIHAWGYRERITGFLCELFE